jgi:hypothetical protein
MQKEEYLMSWRNFQVEGADLGVRGSWPRRLLAVAGLAAGAVVTLPAPYAHAAAVPVSCSVPALVAAINAANDSPGADRLSLARGCTYRLTNPDSANPANGLPVVTSDITIDGRGATIMRDSSAPAFRILFVDSTGTLKLNKTTISGGRATTTDCPLFPGQGTCGGGILNAGTLTVNHSRVINNTATSDLFVEGGGIDNDGTATVNNTEVSGNTVSYTGTEASAATGGGIASNGPLTVNHSRVAGNTATVTADTGSIGEAAGISNFTDATIKKSVIRGNHANAPGGIARGALVSNAPPPAAMTVTDTILSDNTTEAPGGLATGGAGSTNRNISLIRTRVIGNYATAPDGGTVRGGGFSLGPAAQITVNRSTVQGNTASAPGGGTAQGGGFANTQGGTLTVERSRISNNTVSAPGGGTAQGGGVAHAVGSTSLNESRVTGNRAGDGGGIYKASGTLTLDGSVVRGNRPNNCSPPGSVPGCTG